MPILAKVEVFIVDARGWLTSRSECLLVTTASVIEHSEGHAHTRWNIWLQGVDQTLRLIPQSLDREVKEGFLWSATDRKGMSLPPMSSFTSRFLHQAAS